MNRWKIPCAMSAIQNPSDFGTSLPDELQQILAAVPELAGALVVGGCIRDFLLGLPNKDHDVEVYGVGYDALAAALSRCGQVDRVGQPFGVVKVTLASGAIYDFSLPRRELKVAKGHKGFDVIVDPNLPFREAASRRDFTINALAYDPRRRVILDPFGGLEDLRQRRLRHVSGAFVEDPLRVLRGMQFAGRFNLVVAPETAEFCRGMRESFAELAVERVRDEWMKWAQKSTVPSAGLRFLEAVGWIDVFPEVNALRGVPQDPEWHPEGDVFVHTGHCCDAMARLPGWRAADAESRATYMLAMLSHDFAKPQTTQVAERNGVLRIVSPGHEEQGGPLAEAFLQRIGVSAAIIARVVPLVVHHLAHLQTLTERGVRRLAKRLEPDNIEGLVLVMTADHMGRPPKPAVTPPTVLELLRLAEVLKVQSRAPRPILLGRHLIAAGLRPGPAFSGILSAAFEAQLEGQFEDLEGALGWLGKQGFPSAGDPAYLPDENRRGRNPEGNP